MKRNPKVKQVVEEDSESDNSESPEPPVKSRKTPRNSKPKRIPRGKEEFEDLGNPVFNIYDLVTEIVKFLEYPDILALRCCKKLAFDYLSIQSLYKQKTIYLEKYHLNPEQVAKACKNRNYLKYLTGDKVKLDREKLFTSLRDCPELNLVSGILTLWRPKKGRQNENILEAICQSFFEAPLTPQRISLIKTYCRDWTIETRCLKLDDLEVWKKLVGKSVDIDRILCLNAYKILDHVLQTEKPFSLTVNLNKISNISRLENILTRYNYHSGSSFGWDNMVITYMRSP